MSSAKLYLAGKGWQPVMTSLVGNSVHYTSMGEQARQGAGVQ